MKIKTLSVLSHFRVVHFFIFRLCCSAIFFSRSSVLAEEPERIPNFIVFVADDLGAVDLNCYGATDLSTPHIDELAKKGIRFTQLYVPSSVCSPSRAAFLTGRNPDMNGVIGNARSFHADEITIAEMLKPAGYTSGLIGKWHLGMQNGGPNGEGFDYFFGHRGGCIENWKHDTLNWDTGVVLHPDLWRNMNAVDRDGEHFGELMVEETIGFLRQNQDKPFFAYVAFNNPHYPVQPLKHHFDAYAHMDEPRRSYAAFVSTMDEQIGRIMQEVDSLGLRGNTVVVFFSDHGHSPEKRNMLFIENADPENPAGGSSGIYNGEKFQLTEGGVRVPFIISQPGYLPAGETRNQMTSTLDLLPTFAELTGVPLPDKPLDGKSLVEILHDKNAPATHKILRFMSTGPNHWAIRKDNWKLRMLGRLYLTNLENDVEEKVNLVEEHPEIVEELTDLHTRLRSGGAWGTQTKE